MPRIPRHLIKDHDRCYHIMSRTAGQEFLLGDEEKEYLMERIKRLSSVYFTKVFSISILSNHFHLLVKMQRGEEYSDEEIERRFRLCYGSKRKFPREKIETYRKRWSDLSWFVKDIKQGFSFWYNREHDRRGYFWAERFTSVVVEDGEALVSCMAYVDLNAVRANIVDRPEDYRFCGLGYHLGSGNKDGFLTLDLVELCSGEAVPLECYRRFVYEVGSLERADGKRPIPKDISEQEARSGYKISASSLFRSRSRYFTDSVVIGSKGFVRGIYNKLQPYLQTRADRQPVKIHGSEALYSMRRLQEPSA